jgi:CRP-like cAMP-binding protein
MRCPRRNGRASSRKLELVTMTLGDVLYESGVQLRYVYFPTDSIVSLLYVMEDGSSAEIAVVGNEGMVGVALFMGGETTPSRALVQSAGSAYRLKGQVLKDEFLRATALQHLLLRYTQALLTQMAQTAVCKPAPLRRSAALPLAPAEPGPAADQQAAHDPGTDREHARRAPRGRDRGRGENCRRPAPSTTAGGTSPCSTARGSRRWPASATGW